MPRRGVRAIAPDVLMLAGLIAVLAGLYVLFGLGWVLLAGGLAVGVIGLLLDQEWL